MADSALTAEQLIEELQKVKNKKSKVYYERDSWSIEAINRVVEHKEGDEDIVLL